VRGRAGADQPGRGQGSLPAPAALSTRQRTDSQRCVRPAIPGSAWVQGRPRPGRGAVRVQAWSGPTRLPARNAASRCRRPRRGSPARAAAQRAGVSIPVTWSSTATACRCTSIQHEERGRPDDGREEHMTPGRGRRRKLAVVSVRKQLVPGHCKGAGTASLRTLVARPVTAGWEPRCLSDAYLIERILQRGDTGTGRRSTAGSRSPGREGSRLGGDDFAPGAGSRGSPRA
jgi:hypothetical protein